VHQGVGFVGRDHGFVVRDVVAVQAIAHAQIGHQARQYLDQQFLERAQAGIQCGGGHDQRVYRAHVERYKASHHQATHAVTEQNEGGVFIDQGAGVV